MVIREVDFWRKPVQTENIVKDGENEFHCFFQFKLENDETKYLLLIITNRKCTKWEALSIGKEDRLEFYHLKLGHELIDKIGEIFKEIMQKMEREMFYEELSAGVVFNKKKS
jgi:hypothetical protein